MVHLKNGILEVAISENGAEIKSIKKEGTEYIWQSNPEIWGGSAPILFPICGGLRDDKYVLGGKEYNLPKHGFARKKQFAVQNQDETTAVFLLTDDQDTIKCYPFKFELRVIYTLNGSSLNIKYNVKNLSENTMYFSIGSHEAYSTPEGVEDYDVIFSEKETLNAYILDGNLLSDNTLPIVKDSEFLPLYDKYFLIDALVFKDLNSRKVTLRNRLGKRTVEVSFPDCDYFLIWHKHSAGYICLEPWSGIQDSVYSDYDITRKEGINALEGGCEYQNAHTVTIL